MRQIGALDNEAHAYRFADYLVTCGMESHAEPDDEKWAIWVRDEDHVSEALKKFEDFQQNPNGEEFKGVTEAADAIRVEEMRRRERARSNVVEMRTQWKGLSGGATGPKPLAITLIVISVAVFLLGGGTEVQHHSTTYSRMFFIDFLTEPFDENVEPVNGPFASIAKGEVWRLITPIFLHFSVMHLLMNSLATIAFAGQLEARWSTLRLGVLVVVIAIVSNLCAVLLPKELGGHAYLGGGLSGVLYGVFGYLWMKSRYDRRSGIFMSDSTVIMMLAFMFICMTPLMESMRINNVAHVSGLLCGMALAMAPLVLSPSKE